MLRTTVRLPDALLDDAKRHARRTGRTLTQLIEDGVRSELARSSAVLGAHARVGEATPRYGDAHVSDVSAVTTGAFDDRDASDDLSERVAEIQEYVRRLPLRDRRTTDEILGYDTFGVPT